MIGKLLLMGLNLLFVDSLNCSATVLNRVAKGFEAARGVRSGARSQ